MKITYEIKNDSLIPLVVTRGEYQTPVWFQQNWQDGEFSKYIRENGCGHCSVTMVARLKGNNEITPYLEYLLARQTFGEPSERFGYKEYHFISVSGIVKMLDKLSIKASYHGIKQGEEEKAYEHIINALKQDKMVIYCAHPQGGKPNIFSKGDHYVVFIGLDGDKIVTLNSSLNGVYNSVLGLQYATKDDILGSMFIGSAPIDLNWGILPNLELVAGYVIVE